jgi:hypothetical protein
MSKNIMINFSRKQKGKKKQKATCGAKRETTLLARVPKWYIKIYLSP